MNSSVALHVTMVKPSAKQTFKREHSYRRRMMRHCILHENYEAYNDHVEEFEELTTGHAHKLHRITLHSQITRSVPISSRLGFFKLIRHGSTDTVPF